MRKRQSVGLALLTSIGVLASLVLDGVWLGGIPAHVSALDSERYLRPIAADDNISWDGSIARPEASDIKSLSLSASSPSQDACDLGHELLYSTYLGGSGDDSGKGIVVDRAGHLYLTGHTTSPDFPGLPEDFSPDSSNQDVFVIKMRADGTLPVYTAFLGSNLWWDDSHGGIALDESSSVHVTYKLYGSGTVAKLDSSGSVDREYSCRSNGAALAADRGGSVYLTGAERGEEPGTG